MSASLRVLGLTLLVSLVALCLPAVAEVTLPSVIGSNMVLQRDMRCPIWGKAAPGEAVRVSIGDQVKTTVASPAGQWMVRLDRLPAGGPHTLVVSGHNRITLHNVLVGEVWVCSGQSNMQMSVAGVRDASTEIANATYPDIRLVTVPCVTADKPQDDFQGSWTTCSPQTVPGFSAVGYFFGRKLHQELKVPVGLINTSWGGTPAESWTSRPSLEEHEVLTPILERWDKIVADYPAAIATYNNETIPAWEKEAAKARAEGKEAPPKPGPPSGPDHPWRPASLFNAMIHPLVPFGIRGAIWYQGESNADRAYQYRTLFPAMIRDWREAWGQGDFAFLFVQLANFHPEKPEPGESTWAELREAQTMTLKLKHTGMATIIDIGDAADIHPKNKQDVGIRLALWPLSHCFGRDIECSGPLYKSMHRDGDAIRIKFGHVGKGLVAKGSPDLVGFAIAGADRRFVWADAVIDGDEVVVSSRFIHKPVAVRYAWAENPRCNLFNLDGLPASPFRTDDWPMVTANAR